MTSPASLTRMAPTENAAVDGGQFLDSSIASRSQRRSACGCPGCPAPDGSAICVLRYFRSKQYAYPAVSPVRCPVVYWHRSRGSRPRPAPGTNVRGTERGRTTMGTTLRTQGSARPAETFDALNPATSEVIESFPVFGEDNVAETVEAA